MIRFRSSQVGQADTSWSRPLRGSRLWGTWFFVLVGCPLGQDPNPGLDAGPPVVAVDSGLEPDAGAPPDGGTGGDTDAGFDAGTVDAGPQRQAVFPPTMELIWRYQSAYLEPTTSSLRTADLNGDGVLDFVLGAGEGELEVASFGGPLPGRLIHGHIDAIDGRTGTRLWTQEAGNDLYGSAMIADLGPRPGLELVIGGRDAQLHVLDAESGERLWQFSPTGAEGRDADWFNWTVLWPIGDLTGDGWQELLGANGGDSTKEAFEARDPGQIVLLSGADGEVLLRLLTPDRAETYMGPVIYEEAGQRWFLFGTGGETHAGSLWRISLDVLLNTESLESAEEVVGPTTHKGMIAPPVLVDLTGDERLDIVIASYDGRLIATETNGEVIWQHVFEGCESWITPAIGYFDDDDVPDVFAGFNVGTWPMWTATRYLAVSGATGAVLYNEQIEGRMGMASPLAVDLDADGLDEVLFPANIFRGSGRGQVFHILNFPEAQRQDLISVPRLSLGTGMITDVDGDGWLEWATPQFGGGNWSVELRDLSAPAPPHMSWNEYVGPDGRGIFRTRP